MSDRISPYLGKKYACPGCQAKLKFRRPPTQSLLTCPSCRRKLRLQDQEAAANKDELIREAIDSLLAQQPQDNRPYNYDRDPRLDRVDYSPENGVWKFDQPWPDNVQQVVFQRAEVQICPSDIEGILQSRRQLLEGTFRRVTVARTDRVEEMEVTGYWWDCDLHSYRQGLLSRCVVRELNRIVTAKQFAARINCIQRAMVQDKEVLELFVDVAVQESPKQKFRERSNFKKKTR